MRIFGTILGFIWLLLFSSCSGVEHSPSVEGKKISEITLSVQNYNKQKDRLDGVEVTIEGFLRGSYPELKIYSSEEEYLNGSDIMFGQVHIWNLFVRDNFDLYRPCFGQYVKITGVSGIIKQYPLRGLIQVLKIETSSGENCIAPI